MMKTRYPFIKYTITKLIINCNINKYPIDILNIFSKINKCRVISYSHHMNKYNIPEEEILSHLGSDEGCTIYDKNKDLYLIFYNDLNKHYKSPSRRLWTLAHELGHLMLGHHKLSNKTKIFRNNLTDDEYQWLETEANSFAALLLSHPIILNKLNIQAPTDISRICNLSKEASEYRFDYIKNCYNSSIVDTNDKLILNQFYNFINKKYCLNCNYGFTSEKAKYCPICSYNKLKWGDGSMIYDDGYELGNKGRVLQCPLCANEEIFDGVFCKICSSYLINKCTNNDGIFEENEYGQIIKTKPKCGAIADGNARFCIYCGEPTTFYQQGFLFNWNELHNQYDEDTVPF